MSKTSRSLADKVKPAFGIPAQGLANCAGIFLGRSESPKQSPAHCRGQEKRQGRKEIAKDPARKTTMPRGGGTILGRGWARSARSKLSIWASLLRSAPHPCFRFCGGPSDRLSQLSHFPGALPQAPFAWPHPGPPNIQHSDSKGTS